MRAALLGLACALAIANSSVVCAQTPAAASPTNSANSNDRAPTNSDADRQATPITSGAPNDRTLSGFHLSSFQLSSEEGKTLISGSVSVDLFSYDPSDTPETNSRGEYVVERTKFGVTASAPIDGENQPATFFSGDSLVSGSKMRISVTNFRTVLGTGAGTRAIVGRAYRKCVMANTNLAQQQGGPVSGLLANIKSVSGVLVPDSNMTFEKAFGGQGLDNLRKQCFVGDDDSFFKTEGDLIEKYAPDYLDDYDRGFFPARTSMRFIGFDASMGREDHKFLDRTNFAVVTEPRTSWEVAGYFGWVTSDTRSSIRFRGVYGQTYVDNDDAEICRTVSTPVSPECISSADGPPVRTRTGLISVEGRHLISLPDDTNIAIAPMIAFRTQDSNLNVEVPIYLAPGADGRLSGGIKAAYNSKGDEFSIGLFVGVPFSIFFDK